MCMYVCVCVCVCVYIYIYMNVDKIIIFRISYIFVACF